MKKSLILIATVSMLAACGGEETKSDNPVKRALTPQPGAEVVFVVVNVKGLTYDQAPFHLLGDLEIPAGVDIVNDLRVYTSNFVPTGKEGLIGTLTATGDIQSDFGEYPDTGGIGLNTIGDWYAQDLADGKKHLYIQLYEDDLDFLATLGLLWPNEPVE